MNEQFERLGFFKNIKHGYHSNDIVSTGKHFNLAILNLAIFGKIRQIAKLNAGQMFSLYGSGKHCIGIVK